MALMKRGNVRSVEPGALTITRREKETRKMETKEEKIDREFDELNEGLVALGNPRRGVPSSSKASEEDLRDWQIVEWFEKQYPQPYLDPDCLPEPGSDLDEEWNIWSIKLCYYADGWKDALKALQERQILEKCIEEEPKWFNFFEYIWARPEEYLVKPSWMTRGETRRYQWIIDLMLIQVDEEEWNNGRTR